MFPPSCRLNLLSFDMIALSSVILLCLCFSSPVHSKQFVLNASTLSCSKRHSTNSQTIAFQQTGRTATATNTATTRRKQRQNQNGKSPLTTKRKNDSLENFITLERQRMDKILQFEKRRLQRLTEFLNSEKKRLKELEKQEKKSFSMLLDDDVFDSFSSALVRIDEQRQLSKQRSSSYSTRQTGWTKLILDPSISSTSSSSTSASTTTTTTTSAPDNESEEEFVFLYEPSNTPSMIIMFLGGAGLGQFPHITYSEMLSRISHKLNAAIITTPYQTKLDHYELSKQTGVTLHRALAQCQQSGRFPSSSSAMPKFFLGHSLGSKLWTISTAAMKDVIGEELAGVGLISFNNFGFVETTKQVKTFADTMDVNQTKQTAKMVDKFLDFAEQAVTMSGLEFSPSPKATTQRIIHKKYDDELLKKTRLFVFDDDDLDSSQSFFKAAKNQENLSVSGLPGTHLAPVYIKVGLDDLDFPPEAKELAEEATGGFESFSYGNEEYLIELVDEICDWILGEEPRRGPMWQTDKEKENAMVLQR